jgi:hypothetical protein
VTRSSDARDGLWSFAYPARGWMSRLRDSVEAPGVRDPFQLVFTRILEDQA